MKKGFLLIDGDKNALLVTLDDIDSHKTFNQVVIERIKNHEIKEHKTRADLNKSISEYLKGNFEPGGNENGT